MNFNNVHTSWDQEVSLRIAAASDGALSIVSAGIHIGVASFESGFTNEFAI